MEKGKQFGLMSSDGNFIRKGAVGSWIEEFKNHPDLELEFNNWVDKQMKESIVEFPC